MIEIEEIRNSSNFLDIQYNPNSKILTIDSPLNPNILDRNFNELENRINKLEEKLNKMSFNYNKIK